MYNTTLSLNQEGWVPGLTLLTITGCALLLNVSVITSLFANIRTLPPYMFLVLNLAVSDLVFAIVGFSIRAPGLIYDNFYRQNPFTVFICKSAMFFYLPVLVSINTSVLLLTYDRRCAIMSPLRRGMLRSKRRVFKAIALSWFLTLAVWSILVGSVASGIPGNSSSFDVKFGRCSLTFTTGGKVLHFCMYFVFLTLPALCTLLFYGQIVRCLWGYKQEVMSRKSFTRRHSRVFVLQELKHVGSKITPKSFFTITIILVFYYLTLFPSFFLRDLPMILSVILDRKVLSLPPTVTILTSVAFYISTLVDPIVYGIRSPHIFKTIKLMIWYVKQDDVSNFENRLECRLGSVASLTSIRSVASHSRARLCSIEQGVMTPSPITLMKSSLSHPPARGRRPPSTCSLRSLSDTSEDPIRRLERLSQRVRPLSDCSEVPMRPLERVRPITRPRSFHMNLSGRSLGTESEAGVMFRCLLPVLSSIRRCRVKLRDVRSGTSL